MGVKHEGGRHIELKLQHPEHTVTHNRFKKGLYESIRFEIYRFFVDLFCFGMRLNVNENIG